METRWETTGLDRCSCQVVIAFSPWELAPWQARSCGIPLLLIRCLWYVFDMAPKQTHYLVPAARAPSFLTVFHCQVLLLCGALTWAPRRPFLLHYCLSLAKVQYGCLSLFSWIYSHCLIATWSPYSFIQFRARQVTAAGAGEESLIPR